MSVRQPTAIVVASAFIAGALPMVGGAVGSPGGGLFIAAAQAIDEGIHLGSQLLGAAFLRGFGVRSRDKQAPAWGSYCPSHHGQRAGNESRRHDNGGRLANGH